MPRPRLALLSCLFLLAGCATFSHEKHNFVVFFTNESATLTPTAQDTVAHIAAQVTKQAPSRIEITGQTTGTMPKDMHLADERATAVVAALTQAGVPAALIQINPSVAPGQDPLSRKVLVVLDQ